MLILRYSGPANGDALDVQGSSLLGGGAGVVFGDGLRCAPRELPQV